MALISPIKDKDWVSVRQANARLASGKLGPDATPTYSGITITGLTPLRLVWSDASKTLVSKDLVDLIAGTVNQIIVTDDAAGGVVISTYQDIHDDAAPTFTGLNLEDSNDVTYLYADETIFYIESI